MTKARDMNKRLLLRIVIVGLIIWLVPTAAGALGDASLEPIAYVIRFPKPDTHFAEIEVTVPTRKQATIEMMMAVWSPGFYRVENYASRVQDFAARSLDGTPLGFEQTDKNRWRIQTGG